MNNLENYPTWLVPLDIAQELKAIGFDEPCTFAINYTQYIEPFLVQYLNKGYNAVFYGEVRMLKYKTLDKNLLDKIAIIPTWTEVFAWFRSKGYHSTLHTYSVMVGNVEEFRFYYEINSCQEYIAAPEEYYKTYEEVREKLVYKLIEIYKSGQK
jgi:hypothetical protein